MQDVTQHLDTELTAIKQRLPADFPVGLARTVSPPSPPVFFDDLFDGAMMSVATPLEVIQAQLAAYNAKDIDALLATYAADAEQLTLHGERLAKGHEDMRARFLTRFAEPDLHARLLSRTVMGNIVVDLELITRNLKVKNDIANLVNATFKDIYDILSQDVKMFDVFAPQLKEFEKIVKTLSEGVELIRVNRSKVVHIQKQLSGHTLLPNLPTDGIQASSH